MSDLERITDETALPTHVAESLRHYREVEDIKANRMSSLPADETVTLHCCWVVECYLPSCADGLRNGLEDLGWLELTVGGGHKHSEWLDEARLDSFRLGWANLGTAYPRSRERSVFPNPTVRDLPEGVECVRGVAIHNFPGLTQLVLQFDFEEPTSHVLEAPLRETYSTWVARGRGGSYTFVTPVEQRREAVRRVWREVHERCWAWVGRNLPGVFGRGLAQGQHPTTDLVTLDKVHPLKPRPAVPYGNYCDVLGLRPGADAWRSDDPVGLVLFTHESNRLHFGHTILAGNSQDLFDLKELKGYGLDRRKALLNWLNYFSRSAAVLGLQFLFVSYDRRLAALRDNIASRDLQQAGDATGSIRDIQYEVVRLESDVRPLYIELERFCKWQKSFSYELFTFRRAIPLPDDEPPLFEQIRNQLLGAAPQARELAGRLQNLLLTCANLVSTEASARATKSNIKLQRWIAVLTMAILILTGVLVGLEIVGRLPRSASSERVRTPHDVQQEQSSRTSP